MVALPYIPALLGMRNAQAIPDGLPDCLNHERFSACNCGLAPVGIEKSGVA
jgi:hypothetical protein